VPVLALQWLWSLCRGHQVQFIAVVVHATRPPLEEPQTFANAQRHITDFNDTHGYSPEQVRLFDLTRVEYPIVWRNEGDWERYVGTTAEFPYFDSMGQVQNREEPDLPGISIIDLTRVSSGGSREPGTPTGGRITAVRSGFGTVVGHDLRREDGRLQGYSNLKATMHWVDRQICQILGRPLTFIVGDLISRRIRSVMPRSMEKSLSSQYGEEILQTLEKYLMACLKKGVKPPATIAPTILNMADDYLNGRDLELRPGDHFAIEKYFSRSKKAKK
jgi:hypothetical protein